MSTPQAGEPDEPSPARTVLTSSAPAEGHNLATGAYGVDVLSDTDIDTREGDLDQDDLVIDDDGQRSLFSLWIDRLKAFFRNPSFGRTLLLIAAIALAVRWGFLFGFHRDLSIRGDAWVYYYESRLNATGNLFIDPAVVQFQHIAMPAADHPPLFIFILTALNLLGIQGFLSQIAFNGLLGVVTVVVIGLVGRRIAGPRLGLIAAIVAALYTGLWSWNGLLLSETTSALAGALTMLFAYRYWDDRRTRDLVWLSFAVCAAAMSHGELLLYFPFIVLPLLISTWRRDGQLGPVLRAGGLVTLIAVLLMGPWIGYNLSRFRQPTFITSQIGRALDSGACGEAYFGDTIGFWDIKCIGRTISAKDKARMDQSELDKALRVEALTAMGQNKGQFVKVAAARVGRLTNVYRPTQQIAMDQSAEGREWWVTGGALSTWYLLAGFGIAGAISLRRRHRLLFPLLATMCASVVGAIACFGTTRYRAPSEPALVLVAAVGIEVALAAIAARRTRGGGAGGSTGDEAALEADAGGSALVGEDGVVRQGFSTTITLVIVAGLMVVVTLLGVGFVQAGNYDLNGPKLPSIGSPGLPR